MARNPDRETVFHFKQFDVINASSAMKVGTDGVLLGAWCDMLPGGSVLDVGAGCGLIGLMAAQRGAAMVVGVEIDSDAVAEALINVERSPWRQKISVEHGDFMAYASSMCFDRIVSNPPFFNETLMSPDVARALARHERSLTLPGLFVRSVSMLADNGRIALIAPMSRYDDMIYAASQARLYPIRICQVYTGGKHRKSPSRVLAEFGRYPVETERSELNMQSDEYRHLTSDFYLDK